MAAMAWREGEGGQGSGGGCMGSDLDACPVVCRLVQRVLYSL